MLYYIYLIFILLTGFALAHAMNRRGSFWQDAALAPILGIFVPTMLVYFLNMVGILITANNLWISWLPIGIGLLIWQRKDLSLFFKKSMNYFKSENIWMKIFLVLLVIGFIAMTMEGFLKPIKRGDGWHHWAPKAIEWIKYGKLYYSQQLQNNLPHWVAYPLYHSIGLMLSVLLLPALPAYSVTVFDTIYIWGIFTAALYFISLFGWKTRYILLGGFCIAFVQKELLIYMNSVHAEIHLAYFYFLGFVFLVFSKREDRSWDRDLLAGIVLGVMVITKNEGIYRLIFLYTLLHLFYWKGLLNYRRYLAFAAPILSLWLINKINMPTSNLHDFYYSQMNWSFAHIWSRLPIMIKAVYYSYQVDGILKCFWPLVIFFSFYYWIKSVRQNRSAKALFTTMMAIFWVNWAFNHIPSWVGDPSVDPFAIGWQVVGRLHVHTITFLSAISVVGIFKTLSKNHGFKLTK